MTRLQPLTPRVSQGGVGSYEPLPHPQWSVEGSDLDLVVAVPMHSFLQWSCHIQKKLCSVAPFIWSQVSNLYT